MGIKWFPSVQVPEDVYEDLLYFRRKLFKAQNWTEFLIKVRNLINDLVHQGFDFTKYQRMEK